MLYGSETWQDKEQDKSRLGRNATRMMSWMSNVWPEERTSAEVKETEGALQDRRL